MNASVTDQDPVDALAQVLAEHRQLAHDQYPRCTCGWIGTRGSGVDFLDHQAQAVLASPVVVAADKVRALADELSERGWQHEDVPGMLLRLLSEPAREPEQRRGDLSVYLALADNSRRPWAVCATREAAIEALDDYLERCWRGTKIMMDWVLLTTPEAEPVWARYFTADGMSDSPKEQLIERRKVRSMLSEPATDATSTGEAQAASLTQRLATALALALHDAHPVYGSTAGWRGGIGGQAMTPGCSFIDPAPGQEWTQYDLLSGPLREYLSDHPFDLDAAKEQMKAELNAAVSLPEGEQR